MTPLLEASAAPAAATGTACETSPWSAFHVSAPALVLALLGGIVLFAVLRKARDLLTRAHMGASRRRLVRRARPIVEAVVVVGYLVCSVPFVIEGQPGLSAAVLALIVLLFVLLAWFALRDAVSGMFLKASEFCKVGDHVDVDGVRGRVRGLGFRVLALETEGGEEAFVPYSRISRQSLVCRPAPDGAHRHSFEVPRPVGVEAVELKGIVQRAVLESHWATPSRSPEVEVGEETATVTLFALDPDRAHDVEARVRRALGDA